MGRLGMTRITALVVVALIAPLAAGCAVLDRVGFGTPEPTARAARPLETATFAHQPGQIEPVHAAAVAQDQAVFWVSSNGCTAKSDLTPIVRRVSGGAVISLRRLKEDRCGPPRPEGVEVSWSFEEMGLEPGADVSVESPYQLPQSAVSR